MITSINGTVVALVLTAVLFSAGCEATSSTPDSTNYVANAEPDSGEERLICRREQPTGSRISERICLTAEDWDKMEQQSQEMLDRATRKAQQYPDQ
jgi:hypothetical protein